jgi:hypothetical protein
VILLISASWNLRYLALNSCYQLIHYLCLTGVSGDTLCITSLSPEDSCPAASGWILWLSWLSGGESPCKCFLISC